MGFVWMLTEDFLTLALLKKSPPFPHNHMTGDRTISLTEYMMSYIVQLKFFPAIASALVIAGFH